MAPQVTPVYGVAPVEAALSAKRRRLTRLWHKAGGKNPRHKQALAWAREAGVEVKSCGADQLFKLCGSKMHQGLVLEAGPLEPMSLEELIETPAPAARRVILALDQVGDPQNLGAIARSAAFLGAQGVLVPSTHTAPLSPAALKASAGALETIPLAQVGNLSEALQKLKAQDYWVLGSTLSADSVPLAQGLLAEKMVLVLGSEGEGMRQLTAKRCDQLLHIPGTGRVESLNVSATAAILMHHFLGSKA